MKLFEIMVLCAAVNCNNRSENGKRMFRLPMGMGEKARRQRLLWVEVIGRKNWNPNDNTRICEDHFLSGKPSKVETDRDFIPSVFSHKRRNDINKIRLRHLKTVKEDGKKCGWNMVPHLKVTEDPEFELVNDVLATNPLEGVESQNCSTEDLDFKRDASIQVCINDITSEPVIVRTMKVEADALMYYTGISNWQAFSKLVKKVNFYYPLKELYIVEKHLLLTLMKLKKDFEFRDLAYRFHISEHHAARIFRKVSSILASVAPTLKQS